jgi:uncharacterized protein
VWILGLLTCIPWVAGAFAVHLFRWAEHARAGRDLESTNSTAGTWLRDEIARRGLIDDIEVVATNRDGKIKHDCFIPRTRTIVLALETYVAASVTAWATAAHELGHALVALRSPLRSSALRFARTRHDRWFGFAIALVVGNMLYARPTATAIAIALLVIATVFELGTLIDEAWASVLAMRALAPHLRPEQRRIAGNDLVLAFVTYAGPAVTRMLVLASWPLILRLGKHAHVPPLGHLTRFGVGVAVAWTAILAVGALMPMLVRAPKAIGIVAVVASALQCLAIAGLIYLGWNRSAEPIYAWCVLLAFARISPLVGLAIQLPFSIPIGVALSKFGIGRRGPYIAPDRRRSRTGEAAMTAAGNKRVAEILDSDLFDRTRRVWQRRIGLAMYLPLAIAFWTMR